MKNPSDTMELLSWGDVSSLGAAVQDLATFVDARRFEYLLVVVTRATLGAGATSLQFRLRSSDVAAGTTPSFATDPTGAIITLTVGTTARAAAFDVRRHGLKQFVSPTAFADAGTTSTATIALFGVTPKDTKELAALSTLLAAGTYS